MVEFLYHAVLQAFLTCHGQIPYPLVQGISDDDHFLY